MFYLNNRDCSHTSSVQRERLLPCKPASFHFRSPTETKLAAARPLAEAKLKEFLCSSPFNHQRRQTRRDAEATVSMTAMARLMLAGTTDVTRRLANASWLAEAPTPPEREPGRRQSSA